MSALKCSAKHPGLSVRSFVDRDMFVRYLGGGIGHGGNTADIEPPAVPDDEPEDNSNSQPDRDHVKDSDDEVASEDEDPLGSYGKEDIENRYSDEEPEVEL